MIRRRRRNRPKVDWEALRAAVFARDAYLCVAPVVDPKELGRCWGGLTLDHVKDDPRSSVKAEDDEEHLVVVCDGHSERGARAGYQWNTSHRPALRRYLWRHYRRECQFFECEQKAVDTVEVDIGPDLDEHVKVAESARRHRMRVCESHLDLLSGGVFV